MEKTERLRVKAGRLITGRWRRGRWVIASDPFASWSPSAGGISVESLRKWLKTNELVKSGKLTGDCKMCAEGAVYVACALDPNATDEDAQKLIKTLEIRLDKIYPGINGLVSFNDDFRFGEKEIIHTLFV